MPKPLVIVFAVAAAVLLASSITLVVLANRHAQGSSPLTPGVAGVPFGPSSVARPPGADPLEPDPAIADLRMLPFELTDQAGATVTNDAFTNRLTIVDFIFTHCPLVCPTLTGQMAAMNDALADTRVQFLSISIDPVNDTPERLRQYAQGFNADPARWRFLRGPQDAVWPLVRDGLKFAIAEDRDTPITLPDGSTMFNIRHPVHFVLVGPKGEILGIYRGTEPGDVDELVRRARAADRRLTQASR